MRVNADTQMYLFSVTAQKINQVCGAGVVVINNASHGGEAAAPLIVPEVNMHNIYKKRQDHCQPELLHHPNGVGIQAPTR